ncbi:PAAR domain-containing protein [Burkholderia stagnalis]|uniref:PAAR domain-containing protein n=1 Tax=Burkholderia stagnalis TaxID=1503054 RepID=UPI000F58D54A|nr:PAAR domain-containing protein [Burkholderia stagnalis]RQQ73152.1 PAAR domain-containing protein [Burkholderia stagnalis]RQQ74560.1 PAAR domain-containing protein [Burkholderia stagnalis]RQQ86798.1 PAAR domain-containing protein [Burkholderia stagnalis]RQQ95460.1 PAAR domain-containing protein [Burkholderia stagnalis]
MSFAFIRDGDTSSHGGRVIASDMTNTVDGKALALLGDMVSCPRCGGLYPIVKIKADLHMTFNGRPVVSEGDMTACGATLIASQGTATASPTSGAGAPVGDGKSVLAQRDGAYRGRFQLVDDETRAPLANHPYTVTSADGKTIQGTTDASGHTDWLNSDQAASLSFSHRGSSGSASTSEA